MPGTKICKVFCLLNSWTSVIILTTRVCSYKKMNQSQSNLASSQDKILYQIKRLGPQTARDLSNRLNLTTMGIRQHLSQLEGQQLISSLPEEAAGRGRPVRRWKLTGKGHNRFPDSHAQVTSELIISIRDVLGEDAIDMLIEKRTSDTLRLYTKRLQKFDSLEDRLVGLCEIRSNEGYMAELEAAEKPGSFLLKEHHCPICIAAKTCQGFCSSELEVFQSLFEGMATVHRVEHILNQARRCTYRIEPLTC